MVTQWIDLRRKGQAYRAIARKFHVDPRTVKSWVQRAGEEKEKEHWEAVARQVDAKYLDEHYQLLVRIGASLLNAVNTEPVDVHRQLDAKALIDIYIQSALRGAADLLQGRGIDVESPQFTALSQNLFDGLMDHEPQLKAALGRWRTAWSDFQQACLKLAQQAGNLLKLKKVDPQVAKSLMLQAVQETLGARFSDEPPRSSLVEDVGEEEAALVRYNQHSSREVYRGPKQGVQAVCNAYEEVLKQVSLEARMESLERAHCSLASCARKVERFVNRLVLKGRPGGRCHLCPHSATQFARR